MTRVRFIFKLLIAMLGPALVAFALLTVSSRFYPHPPSGCSENGDCYQIFDNGLSLSEQVFGVVIFGLLLLSFVLPILLTIRDIQKEKSAGGSPSLLTTVKLPTDKLWKL